MRILKQDLKTEIKREDCDFELGTLVEKEIVIGKRDSLQDVKIENDKETLIIYDTDEIREVVLVYTPYTELELKRVELDRLKIWFINEYREQFEKCTRRIQLGILMSDGSDPKEVLDALYKQAEKNATRIRELEKIIQESKAND